MRIKNMNVRCPDPEMTKEGGGGGYNISMNTTCVSIFIQFYNTFFHLLLYIL